MRKKRVVWKNHSLQKLEISNKFFRPRKKWIRTAVYLTPFEPYWKMSTKSSAEKRISNDWNPLTIFKWQPNRFRPFFCCHWIYWLAWIRWIYSICVSIPFALFCFVLLRFFCPLAHSLSSHHVVAVTVLFFFVCSVRQGSIFVLRNNAPGRCLCLCEIMMKFIHSETRTFFPLSCRLTHKNDIPNV